ncbi:hypothetical protein F8388_006003 [Cannabis sativa]|uniref:Uncharacterized protein n=1 Tax=Cannabis sativa TaxID=3483 RepID=A0A7J6IAX3_CANSA|nr:hypothetical protein F8388_006003 [Cannabis sativa]KAF4404743.1 hypothetical protein G4B88_006129 [Cannabis sativa]
MGMLAEISQLIGMEVMVEAGLRRERKGLELDDFEEDEGFTTIPHLEKEMGNSDAREPLIEVERDEVNRAQWWNRVLETEEAKQQVLFSLPMIITNGFYYLIPLISVMFAGHLGQLHLAGATLANSWATIYDIPKQYTI